MSLSTQEVKEPVVKSSQIEQFMAMFPKVVDSLMKSVDTMGTPDSSKWLKKVLKYSILGGKHNRGLIVVESYKKIQTNNKLTEENLKLAIIMGWCVEMLQTFLLMIDDCIDESTTRRGMLCWYKMEGVGLNAINDAIMLQCSIYILLKNHFCEKKYYSTVLEMFNETIFKTAIGQYLDTGSEYSAGKSNFSDFTLERYRTLVRFKTSYYSFQLPVNLAMAMSDIKDAAVYQKADKILIDMGELFQIQDDYMDCYGDASVIGKIGSDIENGKCSWLAVVALQKMNTDQIKIMEQYYGSGNPENSHKIREIYDKLDMKTAFSAYEESSYEMIKSHIEQFTEGLPQDLFYYIIEKIYKRKC